MNSTRVRNRRSRRASFIALLRFFIFNKRIMLNLTQVSYQLKGQLSP